MSAPEKIKTHFKSHWVGWFFGVLNLVAVLAGAIIAQDWVNNKTKEFLRGGEGRQAISSIMEDTYKNAIGASYSAHFVLGKKRNTFEYSIPIYVMGGRPARLYLEMADSGAGEPVKIELSIEGIKINYALDGSSPTKVVDLTPYIAEAKKQGVYNFNDNIITISFRADPTQKTSNIVSVKALINVHGLPVMGR